MDQNILAQREKELREQYPDMFARQGLQPDEIWLGDFLIDVATLQTRIYISVGLQSARNDSANSTRGRNNLPYWPIFVNLKEFIEIDEAYKAKKATGST